MPEAFSIYDVVLPILQDRNTYGAGFPASDINLHILKQIDAHVRLGDETMGYLSGEIKVSADAIKSVEDHNGFSGLVERYLEAAFYLLLKYRSLGVTAIPAGGAHGAAGKSPDFSTVAIPKVFFEIKTIDVADPPRAYGTMMNDGLEANVAARSAAEKSGIGFAESVIDQHGNAESFRVVVEQVMRKIDSNIKKGQYDFGPTFLVVSTTRTALRDGPEGLKRRYELFGMTTKASGHLFTIAAHEHGESFFWLPEPDDVMPLIPDKNTEDVQDLGVIARSGILIDHPYIAGLIFLRTIGEHSNDTDPFSKGFQMFGIWNTLWEKNTMAPAEDVAAAKRIFEALCDDFNDTEDLRSANLPDYPPQRSF